MERYKYRKRWAGDNPDGNFDQIFVFAPYKGNGLKESLKLQNESKTLISEGNVLGKIFNTFAGLVGKEAGTKTTDTEHYRYLTK